MLGPALRGLGAVAKFAGRHWAVTGATVATVATDKVIFDGEGLETLGDGIKSAASTVTDPQKRAELKQSYNQTVADLRKTKDSLVGGAKKVSEFAENPEKAIEDVLLGSDTPAEGDEATVEGGEKKRSGGLLARFKDFFTDDDNSVNWINTALTGVAGLWGGSKIFGKKGLLGGLFGGGEGENKGSGFFGTAFKLLGLAAIGGLIYKYWDNIKGFGNKIADSGKNLVNKFTDGENSPQFSQSGGLQDRVIEAPTSVASLGTPAAGSPIVAQKSLDGIEPLGGTFSTSTAVPPVAVVASTDANGITSVVNNAASPKPAETDEEYGARRVKELNASLASSTSPLGTEFQFGARMSAEAEQHADTLPKRTRNTPTRNNVEPDILELDA